MNDILYLEPDDEITVVIDRMKASESNALVLVMPRGSTLSQSIVNLKILKRNAEEQDKEIFLVTGDRITQNIASQVGITVYSKVTEAERAFVNMPAAAAKQPDDDNLDRAPVMAASTQAKQPYSEEKNGFRVNSYAKVKADEESETEAGEAESTEEDPEATAVEPTAETEEAAFVKKRVSIPVNHGEAEVEEDQTGDDEQEDRQPQRQEVRNNHDTITAAKPQFQQHNVNNETTMSKKSLHSRVRVLTYVFSVIIIVALVFAYLFLPYASASLTLKTEDYNKETSIKIQRDAKSADSINMIIPGTLVELEKETTKQYVATGTKEVGDKAKGRMTVYNSYDTSSHSYPAGTKFSASGKVFLADAEFTVTAATLSLSGGTVNVTPGEGAVNVTAEQAGEGYNLAATTYVVTGAPSKITAKADAMTGGTTRTLKVVTEKDITDAAASLKSEITETAKKEIGDKASGAGLRLLDSGLVTEVISESHDKEADVEADNFNCIIKVKIFGLGFSERDLRNVMIEAAQSEIKNKMLVNPDKSELKFEVTESDRDMGNTKLKVTFIGKVAEKIEEKSIKNLIKNKSMGQAAEVLKSQKDVSDAKVTVWPTFIGRTPLLTNRLRVNFDYAQ